MNATIDLEGEVVGRPLVGTVGLPDRGSQQLVAHVGQRQVVTGRQPGLEQDRGGATLRHLYTIHNDLYVPRAVQDIHSRVGISRMRVDGLVLLPR